MSDDLQTTVMDQEAMVQELVKQHEQQVRSEREKQQRLRSRHPAAAQITAEWRRRLRACRNLGEVHQVMEQCPASELMSEAQQVRTQHVKSLMDEVKQRTGQELGSQMVNQRFPAPDLGNLPSLREVVADMDIKGTKVLGLAFEDVLPFERQPEYL